ncbi:MAG: helix-turn-helix domain-containing protein, partial [Pseudolabrys sp.]
SSMGTARSLFRIVAFCSGGRESHADLHGSDELPLTQEYIAQMLGVRRTSVTVVARTLQEAGMIRYKRGHINLIDVPALQETACECYHTVKMNYDALLHPSNR